jgi:hypothetical protein
MMTATTTTTTILTPISDVPAVEDLYIPSFSASAGLYEVSSSQAACPRARQVHIMLMGLLSIRGACFRCGAAVKFSNISIELQLILVGKIRRI